MSNSSFICGYDGESDYQYDNRQGLRHRYSVRWFQSNTTRPEANGRRELVGCIVWTDKKHPPVSELEGLHPGYVVAWYKPSGTFRTVEVTNGQIEVENCEWFYFGEPKQTAKITTGEIVAMAWALDCIEHNIYTEEDFEGLHLVGC